MAKKKPINNIPAGFIKYLNTLSSVSATSKPTTSRSESEKPFICYKEDRCPHKDCEYSDAHKSEGPVYTHKGLDYYWVKCPYRYERIKCYEVFGIHLIREANRARYVNSGETRIKNLEARIEQMRERLAEMRRKHDVTKSL